MHIKRKVSIKENNRVIMSIYKFTEIYKEILPKITERMQNFLDISAFSMYIAIMVMLYQNNG